jgi:hypothetical protein
VLTAELTLDDGTVVYVTDGVAAPAPASGGQITVRIPAGTPSGGRTVTHVLIRSDQGAEVKLALAPPLVPADGYLDVPVTREDLTLPPGWLP